MYLHSRLFCALCPGFEGCRQLCDQYAGYGALQCGKLVGGCPGAALDTGFVDQCHPYHVWTKDTDRSTYYYAPHLQRGVLTANWDGTYTYAFSVRCVLGLKSMTSLRALAKQSGVSDFHTAYKVRTADKLCDRYSGYGALRCYKLNGGCPGATLGTGDANNCYPYATWSESKASSSGYYYVFDFRNGSFYNPFGTPGHIHTYALTVRCVLGLKRVASLQQSGVSDFHRTYKVKTADQLCDRYAGNGALRCGELNGGCPGSSNSNCYPYIVWSIKRVGDTNAWSPELSGGSLFEYNGDAGHITTQAIGVRCVLGLNVSQKTTNSFWPWSLRRGGCPGPDNCYPYHIWSDSQVAGMESSHYAYYLNNGAFGEYIRTLPEAYSVRCVPGLKSADSSVTGMPAMALLGATSWMTAARALRIKIATQSAHGQVHNFPAAVMFTEACA